MRSGLNFTLETRLGQIHLLGEVAGGGTYETLIRETVKVRVFGMSCRCLTLDALIRVKRAAGRFKDGEAIAKLEALRESRHEG